MLRIAVSSWHPQTYDCALTEGLLPSSKCDRPGLDAELLGFLLEHLKLPYYLIPIWDNAGRAPISVYMNGTFGGTLGLILNETVDTSVGSYSQTDLRNKHFLFSYPIYQNDIVYLVKRPKPDFWASALLVFKVFNPLLWAGFFASFLLCVLMLIVFKSFSGKQKYKHMISRTFWSYYRYVILQCCETMRESSLAGNGIVVLLGFAVVLLTGLYQTCLLGQLLHPSSPQLFSDDAELFDMISKKEVTVLSTSDPEKHWLWYYQDLGHVNLSYFEKLRAALDNNPIKVQPNIWKALDMVEQGPYIYPIDELTGSYLIKRRCGLTHVKSGKDLPKRWHGFVFKKKSLWVKYFEESIIMTSSHNRHIFTEYTKASLKCYKKPLKQGQPLQMVSFSGLFALLVVGIAAASIAMCVERSFGKGTVGRQAVVLASKKIPHIR